MLSLFQLIFFLLFNANLLVFETEHKPCTSIFNHNLLGHKVSIIVAQTFWQSIMSTTRGCQRWPASNAVIGYCQILLILILCITVNKFIIEDSLLGEESKKESWIAKKLRLVREVVYTSVQTWREFKEQPIWLPTWRGLTQVFKKVGPTTNQPLNRSDHSSHDHYYQL